MNLTKIVIPFIFFCLMIPIATAKNPPLLVLDMADKAQLPGQFRTTSMPIPNHINQTGFETLHLIGSRQFSKQSLAKILQYLDVKKVLIVDLRQESHGFLNGDAISWYGKQDSANAGKSPEEIEGIEASLLEDLSKQKVATVYEILHKTADGQIEKVRPIQIEVRNVLSEQAWAIKNHFEYQRLYIQDFHPPDVQQVDRFIEFVKQDSQGRWIYFHCRGGSGRSTTLMAMYDMMKNAKQVSIEDILERQIAIGGKDLRQLPDQDAYKYRPAIKRLAFIEKFYQYCRSNQDHYRTTWSEWLKKNT